MLETITGIDKITEAMDVVKLTQTMKSMDDSVKSFRDMIETFDSFDIVEPRIMALTKESKDLTEAEINEVFEGTELPPFLLKLDDKRQYIDLVVSTAATVALSVHRSNDIKAALEEYREEMRKELEEFGSGHSYLKSNIAAMIKEVENDIAKSDAPTKAQLDSIERFNGLLFALDDSFDHTELTKSLEKTSPANVLYDYVRNERQEYVHQRYLKVTEKMKLTSELLNPAANIESKLGEKYSEYPMLFCLAVMRYVSYIKTPTHAQALYVAQTTQNIKDYAFNTMCEEDRLRFEAGVKSVIDVIIYRKQ